MTRFWTDLEDHSQPAGARKELSDRVGAQEVDLLISLGAYAPRGPVEEIDCPRPGGDGCPRRVFPREDGIYEAVCGAEPAQCESLKFSKREIEDFALDAVTFGKTLSRLFRLGTRSEPIAGFPRTLRLGDYSVQASADFPVYFSTQASSDRYLTAFRALWALTWKRGFGVLVPTDRYLSDALKREVLGMGVAVISLNRHLTVDGRGQFKLQDAPERLLRAIGRPQTMPEARDAEAFVEGVFKGGRRQQLTRAEYDAILAKPGAYHVLVDQPGQRCWKRAGRKAEGKRKVNKTYFNVLREIVDSKRLFDPTLDGTALKEREGGKQTCQRMRQVFDLKRGKKRNDDWRLIKSATIPDGRTGYRFDPDAGVEFALLFSLSR